jgi:hypothetical protein
MPGDVSQFGKQLEIRLCEPMTYLINKDALDVLDFKIRKFCYAGTTVNGDDLYTEQWEGK